MLDELRDRIAAYLSTHRLCIVSSQGAAGAAAVPARYRLAPGATGKQALQVDCLLPRWADVTYHLERHSGLLLIILDLQGDGLRWLQVRGTARPIPATDCAQRLSLETSDGQLEHRYLAMRVTPQHIDLVDESQGWGVSQTLDL